jgi:DNA-binding Lrp family transcriptional regulator
MTDPFLENCGGWTPAPDELANKYDFETAYLWGKLRRFCQLGGGTYTASHEAIGDRIGMSRRNLIERLNRLIKDGYVEDLDAGVKNRAHTYSVKKGEAKILSGMQISHTESDALPEAGNGASPDSDVGMRNLHTSEVENAKFAHQDPPAMQNLPSESAEFAHQKPVGMQNLHLKRDSESINIGINPSKESKRESGGQKTPARPPDMIPVQKILVEETGKSRLNKAQIKVIQDTVGTDPPALERWRESVRAWNMCGNKPTDATGMLDWFRSGKRSNYDPNRNGAKQNGTHQKSNPPTGAALAGEPVYDKYTKEIVYPDGTRVPAVSDLP